MKKQELALLVIVRGSNTNRNGLAKTFIRVTLNGHSTECYLGYIVPKDHWDNDLKICLETYPDFKSVNDHIDDAIEELKAHYLVLSKKRDNLHPEDLKRAMNGESGGDGLTGERYAQPSTLLQVADGFIKEFEEMVMVGRRSPETLKQWRATRNKITEFARFQYRRNDILLTDITPTFGKDFYRYLTIKRQGFLKNDKHKRRNINLADPAAKKQMKNVKQLLQLAVDHGLIPGNPLIRFKTSCEEDEVIPLELYQVKQIFDKQIQLARLEEVRDIFIFQCFTGFAYSDLHQLSKQHITYVGLGGEPWLMKERGKTGVNEMVPLLPIALSILEKYEKHPYCIANNKLLPVDSNAKYNAYLKEIAVICGVDRELKTHLARHTFADIMLNECNFPLEDVSKMLGHRSIRTTMRYCRVRKKRISRNMKTAYGILFNTDGSLNIGSVA